MKRIINILQQLLFFPVGLPGRHLCLESVVTTCHYKVLFIIMMTVIEN